MTTQPQLGYEVVPLAYEEIKVAAMQLVSLPVDDKNPSEGIDRNLQRMMAMCDKAKGHQLLVFPEFTLTKGQPGFCMNWTREQWLRVAIKAPGPEIEVIGDKAKEMNAYIVFASYTQEPDWPGHFMNSSMIVAPSGKLIHKHWKAYYGYAGIGIEYATTVFDVLTEFVKKYGWDQVWPVAKTPVGNLATYICSEGMWQESARSMAINGAEILCRSYGGGGLGNKRGKFMTEFRGDCAYNDCWGIYGNNGDPNPGTPETSWGGSCMIVDPYGNIVAQAKGIGEEIVSATIPIGESRTPGKYKFGHAPGNAHMTPTTYRGGLRTELFAPMYLKHQGQFPPDLLTFYQQHNNGQLPPDYATTRKWYFDHARWHLPYIDKPGAPTAGG